MSSHKLALAPLEAWGYSAPDVALMGRKVDVGLLCEALLYYDEVAFVVGNQKQFVELLRWLSDRGELDQFLHLFHEGALWIYEYAFVSAPILKDGSYILMNVQDALQAEPNTFPERYLGHAVLKQVVPGRRKQQRIRDALAGRIIEAKADTFGPAIDAARADHGDPVRNALILQSYVDNLHEVRGLDAPPKVDVAVVDTPVGKQINWGLDFAELSRIGGRHLPFHPGSPLSAGAVANRLLLSASQLESDLYLASPMSRLVGDKLFESAARLGKPQEIISQLQQSVAFPRIRELVNRDALSFSELVEVRRKAKKFRHWLQQEGDRDRDAIIAYHHEVAEESGFLTAGRSSLRLFGVLGGPALGAGISAAGSDPVAAAAAGAGIALAAEVASKLGADWRPVVFGRWLQGRIEGINASKE